MVYYNAGERQEGHQHEGGDSMIPEEGGKKNGGYYSSQELIDNFNKADRETEALFIAAQDSSDPDKQKFAARHLYFLCRNATNAMREIYESDPELFEGIASDNEAAPWTIHANDKPSTEKEWLNTVALASELPPKARTFDQKKDYVSKRAITTAFKKKITDAFRMVLAEWKRCPQDVTHIGKRSRPTEWPDPANNGITITPIPKGANFQKVVDTLGWKKAAWYLPYPSKDRQSDEFKAWLQVVKVPYYKFPVRNKLIAAIGEILEKSEKGKKKKKTPFQFESEQISIGLAAAIQMQKSFGK